jgi:hypothetical protein
VQQVCCLIYSKVEAKEKLLVRKLDNMLKHAHRCKTKVFNVGVKVGSFDFNLKCQHACNDQ